ncbi:MAG: HTTM domain-containing protein [bacterium]
METPRWVLWLLRFQLGAVYFYAGVIKCTSDWLIHAQPLRIFFETENGVPFRAVVRQRRVVHFLAVGGCAFDVFILFALLWRRTRPVALGFVVFFHSFNFLVLGLGLIPSFMILSTFIVFLDPDAFAFLVNRATAMARSARRPRPDGSCPSSRVGWSCKS